MFYITVSNGLLKDGHRAKMGSAVWEFMWFLDKVTKIDNKGMGWVLGGKPIKLKEMVKDLGCHDVTISKNIAKLEKAGYIKKIRTPYGLSIRVIQAKKSFGKRFSENAKSKRFSENAKSPNENAKSNKTITVDNTAKTKEKQVSQSLSPSTNRKISYNKNMKKNSFKYNENIHQDEFEVSIDIDSGEEINPKPKKRKDQDVIDLHNAFVEICEVELGIKPIKDKKGYMIITNALKHIDYNQVLEMYELWFKSSGRPQVDLLAVTKCLSNDQINKYRLQKRQS